MEEADARLQETVACLLNEHGGNYEPALRQTFACLHNSGLYEAQSPAEVEQREQQVLAVFRSFPFRAGAPVDTGVGSRVEETQTASASYGAVYSSHNSSGGSSIASNGNSTAGVAYGPHSQSNSANNTGTGWNSNSSVREPEEAGEVVAAEGDPENVREHPVATAPEALPPLYLMENHEQEGALAPGPELSLQQVSQSTAEEMRPITEDPEGVVDGGFRGSASVAAGPVSGVHSNNARGGRASVNHTADPGGAGEWGEHSQTGQPLGTAVWIGGGGDDASGYPETGEAEKREGEMSGDAARSGSISFAGSRLDAAMSRRAGENSSDHVLRAAKADPQGSEGSRALALGATRGKYDGVAYSHVAEETGSMGRGNGAGNGLDGALGGSDEDPESTSSRKARSQAYPDAASGSRSQEISRCDPGIDRSSPAKTTGAAIPTKARPAQPPSSWIAATSKGNSAASVAAAEPALPSSTPAVASSTKSLGVSFAGGGGKPVAEPHLKTSGQPLVHSNRAGAPTGMSADLTATLKALKLRRRHRFVVMRIDSAEVVAETVGSPSEGAAELRAALPYTDCRYAVYDQEIKTADGRTADKLYFITWLPHNATPHNKMAYSHGKVAVRRRLEGFYDVAASSFEEVEVAMGLVEEDEEESDIEF